MKRVMRRRLFGLLLVMALVGVLGVGASGASAYSGHNYCGILLQPAARCSQGVGTVTQTGNLAMYTGAGTVWVCQVTMDYNTGTWIAPSCGNNGAGGAGITQAQYGHFVVPYVQNGSTSAHTIQGIWYSP